MRKLIGVLSITLTVLFLFGTAINALAQCQGKTGYQHHACEVLQAMIHARNGDATSAATTATAETPKSLTSGLDDTIRVDTLAPTVGPKTYKALGKLSRTQDGSFVLKRGFYELYVESYYFDVPVGDSMTKGAFFPAPIKGERGTPINTILKQAETHPEISQQAIEQLLIAVNSGTPLEKMPTAVQQTAVILLGGDASTQLSAAAQAKTAENGVMDFLNKRVGGGTAAKQEAQPAPVAPTLPRGGDIDPSQPVVRGTWTQMPGGYYVRYLPEGWSRIRIQVMVPEAALEQADPKQPLAFDPTQYLAVLAQAPAQRLGVTLRPVDPVKP